MGVLPVIFLLFAAVITIPLLIAVIVFIVVPTFRGIGWLIAHVFTFFAGVITDTLRFVGAVITAIVLTPLIIANIAIGRWSAATHFGKGLKGELGAAGACLYRVAIGHPAHLLLLGALTEGIERRLPDVVAAAPTSDKPSKRTGAFEGYIIVGSLKGGGSGSKLYVADPTDSKRAALSRGGHDGVSQVVIKSFSLKDGSSLPQIVRESRALDAARRMGLILEHEMSPDRFFYVMRYVPGESLGVVTQRLHASAPSAGLDASRLREAMTYQADLLETLHRYHTGGLWHKDVKPDNIIVHDGRAHLVDFGLVTSLRSAMTLTTHGTEYFRDPEMVRMALQGVKVHEIDGARFDVYAAGACLYSMIEGDFPAHGGLSQITKRCPDALRWIVRRSMADYDKRYESASRMLDDLRSVINASDPFSVKPADLPSVNGAPVDQVVLDDPEMPEPSFSAQPVAAASVHDRPRAEASATDEGADDRPLTARSIRVANWITGRYAVDRNKKAKSPVAPLAPVGPLEPLEPAPLLHAAARRGSPEPGRGSGQLLRDARKRAREAQRRAAKRRRGAVAHYKRKRRERHANINAGVAAGVFVFLGACVALGAVFILPAMREQRASFVTLNPPRPATPQPGGLEQKMRDFGRVAEDWTSTAAVFSKVVQSGLVPLEQVQDLMDHAVERWSETGADGHYADGRLLFVSSVGVPVRERESQVIDEVRTGLQNAGFELLDFTRDAGEEARLLRAEANNVKGNLPFDSNEFADRMSEWLDGNDDVQVVVWVDRDRNSKDAPPRVRVFTETIGDGDGDDNAAFQRLMVATFLSSP